MFEKIVSYFLKPEFPVDPDVLARQIAEQCHDEVCQCVAGQMAGMTLSEARGYVRARGSQIAVRCARRLLLSMSVADERLETIIAQLAIERVIPRAIRQAQVGLPEIKPTRLAA